MRAASTTSPCWKPNAVFLRRRTTRSLRPWRSSKPSFSYARRWGRRSLQLLGKNSGAHVQKRRWRDNCLVERIDKERSNESHNLKANNGNVYDQRVTPGRNKHTGQRAAGSTGITAGAEATAKRATSAAETTRTTTARPTKTGPAAAETTRTTTARTTAASPTATGACPAPT